MKSNNQIPFELKLALKNLLSRRRSFARLTTFVAVAGIAFGVGSLIIAQSLANGFQKEMRDKILANTPHISIFLKDGAQIENWEIVKSNLETTENISNVEATSFEHSIIVSEVASNYSILKVINDEKKFSKSNTQVEISIGRELAEKTNLKSGDIAEIITFSNGTDSKKTRVIVGEIFRTGFYDYDSTWILTSPENFAYLKGGKKFIPSILSLSLKDIYKSEETAQIITAKLDESFRILEWKEANRPLFNALSLEKKASFAIFSLIILIAALNITTTQMLLVNERKGDIAILQTLGTKPRSIVLVFLAEGLILGLIGTAAGLFLGLLGCFFGNYFKIVNISAEVYSINYIPFSPDFLNIILIILTTLILCLAATIYPAFRAGKIKPLENIRNSQ